MMMTYKAMFDLLPRFPSDVTLFARAASTQLTIATASVIANFLAFLPPVPSCTKEKV